MIHNPPHQPVVAPPGLQFPADVLADKWRVVWRNAEGVEDAVLTQPEPRNADAVRAWAERTHPGCEILALHPTGTEAREWAALYAYAQGWQQTLAVLTFPAPVSLASATDQFRKQHHGQNHFRLYPFA